MRISVLDKGFVKLVDAMGDDLRIVQSARVSFGQGSKGPERDRKLINYLVRHGHTSPLESVNFTFHVKAPIFIARQWMRHRTWKFNEISARYTELPDEVYYPDWWRAQSKSNKQASDGPLYDDPLKNTIVTAGYNEAMEKAREAYELLLSHGVAREQARMVLPVSTYTEFYGTVDLHNLLRFLELRIDPGAQWEIRMYALALLDLVDASERVPWTLEAWGYRDAKTGHLHAKPLDI